MLLTSAHLRRIARPLLGLLLFAQGVVAAENCAALEASPVHSFASTKDEMLDADGMSCHTQADDNKNACFVHCTQGEQLHSTPSIMPCLPSQSEALKVPHQAVQAAIRIRMAVEAHQLPGGPPLSIRYCSFQL